MLQIQMPRLEQQKQNVYVSVVTLSTQDTAQLLPELESSFKKPIGWNKYLSK